MTLNNIFQFLVPKDKKFFPLFEQASNNLTVLAETLHEAVNAPKTERDEYFRKIEELEACSKSGKNFLSFGTKNWKILFNVIFIYFNDANVSI